MKDTRSLASIFLLLTFVSSTVALLGLSIPVSLHRQQPLVSSQDRQAIMDKFIPSIAKPPSTAPNEDVVGGADQPVVSDVLPKTKGINIFAQLTRDFDSISNRLNDASSNITVLAPRNSAVQALPRKPWEDPEDYAKYGEVNAYEGNEGQERARRNLRRFVEAHLVPVSPWRAGEEVKTLGGESIKWVKEGDKIILQPGNIEVDSVAEKVANGEVWVLNGVINYRIGSS
ncbi:FAS1 domain-containing protein [Penicillium macrosclerotiorum]|uniref:FAS1 domain-containing protein n=1 Tax=Penicillium macrosclerotiorum TaxID=303699 RepID=UPI0025489BA9|nr:FAS1 domain-containing protein [Penicillium macrosclerotiorum]KAJ5698614.1 FAS1 domain-containing protein [Penicillium macrosclerotiorum]